MGDRKEPMRSPSSITSALLTSNYGVGAYAVREANTTPAMEVGVSHELTEHTVMDMTIRTAALRSAAVIHRTMDFLVT